MACQDERRKREKISVNFFGFKFPVTQTNILNYSFHDITILDSSLQLNGRCAQRKMSEKSNHLHGQL